MEVDDEFEGAVGNQLVWMTLNNCLSIWKLMTNRNVETDAIFMKHEDKCEN